ncbi:MAG: hypothetical protein II844_09700 [Prevotella sp.]|nr:hypothetical protein [Prevotella sp.]
MAEDLNSSKTDGTEHKRHHHHHHHHDDSTSSGEHQHHHHHHHHHSSVKAVTGRKLRRIPWLEGIGLIVVCLILFFVMVMCTKLIQP